MNVFELRERLISDYSSYIRSFIRIRDERVDALVTSCLDQGRLWPDPLIQLNPSFQYACTIDDLVAEGVLHSECTRIFRAAKDKGEGKALRLYQHQADAILGGIRDSFADHSFPGTSTIQTRLDPPPADPRVAHPSE